MDRRLAGVVVLMLVVVAATVAPSLSGQRVAGSAVVMTFPDPPAVGDCALSALDAEGANFGIPSDVDVTTVTWGPCAGEVYGEIVAGASADAAADATDGRRGGGCYRAAATFAGLDTSARRATVPGAPSYPGVFWAPTLGFDSHRVVPGEQERQAGREWSACLAAPVVLGRYQGTLKQAFGSGQLPPEFGFCWEGTNLDLAPALVRCDEPHPAELLATATVRDRSFSDHEQSAIQCRQFAALIMQRLDPTAGGALATVIDPVTSDGASTPDAPETVGCFVVPTGSRELIGTLVGLGEARPVPFAP